MADKVIHVSLPRIDAREVLPLQEREGKGFFIEEMDGDYTVIITAKNLLAFSRLIVGILSMAVKRMK